MCASWKFDRIITIIIRDHAGCKIWENKIDPNKGFVTAFVDHSTA